MYLRPSERENRPGSLIFAHRYSLPKFPPQESVQEPTRVREME